MNKEREEILENSMALQEVQQRDSEPKLGYKEKTNDEIYLGEDILQQLREMKATAQMDLAVREGFQDYSVTNVVHYNKDVELIAIETGDVEHFDLCVVIAEEPSTGEIIEIYYLNGEEADVSQLMRKYESATPIRDVINATEKNLELDPDEQDDELVKDDLEELEEKEKEQEQEKQEQPPVQVYEDPNKNNLTGTKPKYMIQTIDVDKTYVDDKTTVRRAFKIPEPVQGIAIAKPLQEDENALATDMTMYMLDGTGRVIEDVDGQTIQDFFEADDATGKNPKTEENTKFELGGYAERNKNHTMRRFMSKQNPSMHLSVEQKTIGDYAQVYAGRKTLNGNDTVEVQLETRNIPVQTSLEMQKIAAGYKGVRNIKDIDEEVDRGEAEGRDMRNIAKERADGKENTDARIQSVYIPGTEMTWEELSDETGESISKLQDRFQRELEDGKEPSQILAEIEYDYEMTGHEHEHRLF